MKCKKILALVLTLSLFLLCGCGSPNKPVKLELELSPNTGSIEKAREAIKTNSGSIEVSAKHLPKGAQIEVYLYNEASPQDYIMQETIGDVKNSVEFQNLSSDYNYQIGAVLFGTTQNVTLTIEYEEYKAPDNSGTEFLAE